MTPQRKPWPGKPQPESSMQEEPDPATVAAIGTGAIIVGAAVNLAFLGGLVYLGYRIGKG